MERGLKWWQESRFGMFIHFGIYAVSEGKWKGEEVPGLAEWLQFKREIPVEEYRELAAGLTLEKFNAEAYAKLARAAGMKYVVLTAKHHDGFAMYDSKCSGYNVAELCPGHRDVAAELAEAVRKEGLKMCFYYSQALDWEDPNAFGNTWDYPAEEKVYRRFLDGKCKAQLKELLTEYGDIGLIWFDMPGDMSVEESLELKAYVKQFQPECLVSGRINMDQSIGDYGSLGDNEFPSGTFPGLWETPATLNNTWGYRNSDDNWKSPEELIRLLIELLSKGMNYLLNIGPRPDGSIPEKSVEILMEMGKWVSVNAEAVYGTQATPYQFDFPWGRVAVREHVLYLYLLEHMDRLELPGLENEVKEVSLLTESGRVRLPFEMRSTDRGRILSITLLPSENRYYDVIRLELDGRPEVKQGLYELPDGQIHLYSHMAVIHKGTEEGGRQPEAEHGEADVAAERNNVWKDSEFCIDLNGNIVNWFDTENFAVWELELYEPGEYEVLIQTRAAKYTPWIGGHLVAVEMEEDRLTARLSDGERVENSHTRYFEERLTSLGAMTVKAAGRKRLKLLLLECRKEDPAGLLVTKMVLRRK